MLFVPHSHSYKGGTDKSCDPKGCEPKDLLTPLEAGAEASDKQRGVRVAVNGPACGRALLGCGEGNEEAAVLPVPPSRPGDPLSDTEPATEAD